MTVNCINHSLEAIPVLVDEYPFHDFLKCVASCYNSSKLEISDCYDPYFLNTITNERLKKKQNHIHLSFSPQINTHKGSKTYYYNQYHLFTDVSHILTARPFTTFFFIDLRGEH